MDHVAQLQRQFLDYRASLYQEGFLDDEFDELLLQEDRNFPNFVVEMVSLLFEEAEMFLNELTEAVEQQNVDFEWIDFRIHQLEDDCITIGCHRVVNACDDFIDFCNEKNVEGCRNSLHLVKDEYFLVKTKLETLHKLAQEILAAGGSIPLPKQ